MSLDLDLYLRTRGVVVLNREGGRGYEEGVRVFDCPLCGDTKGRGWWTLNAEAAGCWNAGCPAEPRLSGGVIEWVQRHERLASRGEAWKWMIKHYHTSVPRTSTRVVSKARADFCRLPSHTSLVANSVLAREALAFARRRWRVTDEVVETFALGVCGQGRHAWRIVLPVQSSHGAIAFQSRSFRGHDPKYLTSRAGLEDDPLAECARPAGQYLYNVDRVWPGQDVVLVEGPGDVLGWSARPHESVAVGLLGMNMTAARAAQLRAARPRRCYVALDAQPDAQQRAQIIVEDLRAWGLEAEPGTWVGGKDAGDGASLRVQSAQTLGRHIVAQWHARRWL